MALDPALLSQLLGVHPARRMPFDALRAGLLHGAQQKLINVSRDGDLQLFGYSSICQFEQQWDLFSLIARGLILDAREQRIVATPFPKFFNLNEGGTALPDEPFEVTEKIDGSLGICFYHGGSWRVSTRGQLTSAQGQWATQYLNQSINTAALTQGTTYLLEIVYPENRVVIPYDYAGLVLLGAYDEEGQELRRVELQSAASAAGLRITRSIAGQSIADLLEVTRTLPRDEEGFVVRFAGGLRVKLKGDAYCRVHKLICHCTPLALWESLMNHEDLDATRKELPEEMRRDFDSIRSLLQARFESLLGEIQAGHEKMAALSDKELGIAIQSADSGLTEMQRKSVFACRKQNLLTRAGEKGESREKVLRWMRPDRNHLDGYSPSDALSRFEEENG